MITAITHSMTNSTLTISTTTTTTMTTDAAVCSSATASHDFCFVGHAVAQELSD